MLSVSICGRRKADFLCAEAFSSLYLISLHAPAWAAGRYGLFRKMTGVGDSGEGQLVARPELDIQGSNDGKAWQSYIFRSATTHQAVWPQCC